MAFMIAIEGLDGSGKATQSKILAARLDAQLYSFPRYNTPIGSMILRHLKGDVCLMEENLDDNASSTHTSAPEDALALQCMMVADKLAAACLISQNLAHQRHVVCDRWIPSAICYGAADGLDSTFLHELHAALPQAHLSILLDVSPEEALRRRPEARDRYERDREKQAVVRGHYEALWDAGVALQSLGSAAYVKVNGDGGGSGDGPIATVAERVWKAVQAKLGPVGR